MEGNPFAPYKRNEKISLNDKVARSLLTNALKSLVKIKHTASLLSQLRYFNLWSKIILQTRLEISQKLYSLVFTLDKFCLKLKIKHTENVQYAFYSLRRFTDDLVSQHALEAFLFAYYYRRIDKTNHRNKALTLQINILNKRITDSKKTLEKYKEESYLIQKVTEENKRLQKKLASIESNRKRSQNY